MSSIQDVRSYLCSKFVERNREANALILGLLASEHVMMVGRYGCAKSALSRELHRCIHGSRYCERLLSGTTPPEDVFGPIDIVAISQGVFRRKNERYATNAELLFLDEFFRASPTIRDALLNLLGEERQTLIDGEMVQCPLISAVGASNSWDTAADQAAMLDRWLIRLEIVPVSHSNQRMLVFGDRNGAAPPAYSLDQLKSDIETVKRLEFSDKTKELYLEVIAALSAEGINPSDRRKCHAVKIAKAAAFLDGASEVKPEHLEPLSDVLWDVPDQIAKTLEIVLKVSNPLGARLYEMERCITEIQEAFRKGGNAEKIAELKKLEGLERDAKRMIEDHQDNKRLASLMKFIKTTRVEFHKVLLES